MIMKRVLITGANSYIGESVHSYLANWPNEFRVDIKDTMDWVPKPEDFHQYDVVFNVAGIAHIKETKDNRKLYYDINRDLVVNIAKAAKAGGVKQFVLLSTMSVYGKTVGRISKTTIAIPTNSYGDSKLQADRIIEEIADDSFIFTCLRPPMVYGKGCKGNYQSLRKFALKSPIFPLYSNKRSMVYIGNLCDFVKICIEREKGGLFFPQNAEYINTSEMVRLIAKENGKKIKLIKTFNWMIRIVMFEDIIKKVFGSLTYEPVDLIKKIGFEESIMLTEK